MAKGTNRTSQIEKEIGLLELFGEKTLDDLLAAISKVTGLGIVISDYTGKPISEMVNFTDFCKRMRTSNSCQLSDASGLAQATALQKHFIYCCPCGLLEVVIPIIIDHRFLGGFLAGQVRCKNIPDTVPHMQVLSDTKSLMNAPSCREAYEQIPFYEYKTFCDISELIYHIVTLLGQKSMANIRNYQVEKDGLLKETRKLEMENLSLQSRVDSLLQKYDPLFLYNVLTDISNMAYLEEAYATHDMINHLAMYLRGKTDESISIREEADNLKHYLEIIRIKREKVFKYDICIDRDILHKKIPSGLVLPFLKTDIYQLMEYELEQLYIKVELRQEEQMLLINVLTQALPVSSSLQDMDPSRPEVRKKRLLSREERNVIKRLQFLHAEAFSYLVQEVEGIVQVTMTFPDA